MVNRAISRRLLYILFLTQSIFSAAQIAIVTLATIVAVRLSGAESLAGLPSTTTTFAQALAALPVALIMGRFGRRVGLTLGYSLGALGGLVGVLAIMQGQFWLLLVSAALMGVGRASGEQSRFVAGELFPTSERARMIGRIVFAGTIGAIAGPALVAPSGDIMTAFNLDADAGPWAAAAVLLAISALITILLLRPDPMQIGRAITQQEEDATPNAPRHPARPLRVLLALPLVRLAILAMVISQTVMVLLMVITPLHMDHHSFGRDTISMVISAHTLGMFGLSAVTGYLIDRFGRIAMLGIGALTLMLSAVMAPLVHSELLLALALFLLGLGWNFGYVAGSSLLADALQGAERARVQGINDMLVFTVAGIGSLSTGPIFAAGDYLLVSLTGMLLTGMLFAAIAWLSRPRVTVAESV